MLLHHWLDTLRVRLAWVARFGKLPRRRVVSSRQLGRIRKGRQFAYAADVLETRQLLSAIAVDDQFVVDYNQLQTPTDLYVLDNDWADGATLSLVASPSINIDYGTVSYIAASGDDPAHLQFVPGQTYISSLNFDYQITDGVDTETATVTLDLLEPSRSNDPVSDDDYTLRREDELLTDGETTYSFQQTGDGLQVLDTRSDQLIDGATSKQIYDYAAVSGAAITVDPAASYTYSGWFRAGDDNGTGYVTNNRHYLGIREYDYDGNRIDAIHVTKFTGATDTELAMELNDGDTSIYVKDAFGWSGAGGAAHTRNFAWYGYSNISGETYADYTYTRNVTEDFTTGVWDTDIVDQGDGTWKITLLTPWAGGTVAVDTAIRNAQSGSSFNYSLGASVALPSGADGWNYRIAEITGTYENGAISYTRFRPGVYYITPFFKANYHTSGAGGETDLFEFEHVRFGETQSLLIAAGDGSIQDGQQAAFLFDGQIAASDSAVATHLADELIRIDPTDPYTLTGSYRSGVDNEVDPTSSIQQAIGLAQYDISGTLLGYSHDTLIDTKDQWESFSITIAGQKDAGAADGLNQFFADAYYVRPVVMTNTGSVTGNLFQWRDLQLGRAWDVIGNDLQELTFGDESTYSTSEKTKVYSNGYLAVNLQQQYEITVDLKAEDQGGTIDDKNYFGFSSYDLDYKVIKPVHVLNQENSVEAEVVVPFNPTTDTVLYLSDTTNWSGVTSDGNAAHTRNLSFMNYADSAGNTYTDYSRFTTEEYGVGMWDAGTGITSVKLQVDGNDVPELDGNGDPILDNINGLTFSKITFRTGETVEDNIVNNDIVGMIDASDKVVVGTKVRNAISGSTFSYAVMSNKILTSQWQEYSAVIGGGTLENGINGSDKFRPGTAFIQLVGMFNWKTSIDDDDVTLSASEISLRNASVQHLGHDNGKVTANLDVLRNDAHASDPQSVAITIVSQPEFGTVAKVDGNGSTTHDTITYTTPAGEWFAGTDLFQYSFVDAAGDTQTATVRVNVLGHDIAFDLTPGSDWEDLKSQTDPATNTVAPTTKGNYFTGSHDNNLIVGNVLGVLSDDTAGDTDLVVARLTSGTQHGSLKLNADGSFDYRPLAGFVGFDYFTYEAIDGLFKSESTVTLEITNTAPVLGNQTFSIPENSPNGTVISTTLATDVDANEVLLYQINSGDDNSAFAFNTSGQLEVYNTSLFDFETTPSYTLNITVTDSQGLTDTANITINVTDVNEAPVLDDQTFSIPENNSNGTIISTTLATDVDANEVLLYQINSGDDNSAFAFNTSGQLEVYNTSLFDFETTQQYILNITVTDSLGLTDTANITINVTDVNEAPTISTPTTANVDENTTAVLDLAASDPEGDSEGSGLTYDITGGVDNDLFSIDTSTGVLTFKAAPNYEAPADDGSDNVYNVQVTVTDSGSLTDVQDLVITVGNVNESPIILAGQTFDIDENSAYDAEVQQGGISAVVVASDPDAGHVLSYAISGTTAFAIHATTGQITVTDPAQLDFETTTSFAFDVTVTDSLGLTDTANITINVTDVNEAPVGNSYSFIIDENTPVGTSIGIVQASDPDAGDVLSYTLAAEDVGGPFSVDSATGELTYSGATALDFETTPQYTPTVIATDIAGATAILGITVDPLVINTAPVSQVDHHWVASGGSIALDVLSNDYDSEGAVLALSGVEGELILETVVAIPHGTVVIQPKVSDQLLIDFETAGGLATWGSLRAYVNDQFADENLFTNDWDDTVVSPEDSDLLDHGFDNYYREVGDPRDAGKYVLYYVNTDTLFLGTETLSYTVTDPEGLNQAVSVSIDVVDPNAISGTTPEAVADSYVIASNQTLEVTLPEFGLLQNDFDMDDDSITASLVANASDGLVAVNSDGTFTYTPDTNFVGQDSFTYSVTDSLGNVSATQSVLINVSINSPLAINDQVSVEVGQSARFDPTANDLSTAAGTLRLIGVSAASQGTVTIEYPASDLLIAQYEAFGGDQTHGSLDQYIVNRYGTWENYSRLYDTEENRLRRELVYTNQTLADGQSEVLYYVIENASGQKSFGTITVTGVAASNLAPVALDDDYYVDRDDSLEIDLRENDSDPDGDSLTYQLSETNTVEHGELIAQRDGTLTYYPELGYEGDDSFEYILSDGELTIIGTVSIHVQYGYETNTAPVLIDLVIPLDENSLDGVNVGVPLLATDVENDVLTYQIISGNDSGAFALDASTGQITVADSTQLDYETVPEFILTVEVTDDGFPNLTTTAEVTISLTDVNDAPTVSPVTWIVVEDAVLGTVAGNVSSTDDDALDTHTYAITAGNTNSAFAINADTGEITVADASAVDFLVTPVFNLTVQSTDSGTGNLTGTDTITILVQGVGSNANVAPVFSDVALSVAENTVVDTIVQTLLATDDVAQTLTYSILSGNEDGVFAISDAGVISIADPALLDYETTLSYTLSVDVTDNGVPNLTSTATVTINVTDVNDAPEFETTAMAMLDDLQAGDVIGTVVVNDFDAGSSLTYSFVSGNEAGLFAIDSSTGEISVDTGNTTAFDAEVTSEYVLRVAATDGTETTEADVTINVAVQTKTDLQKTLESLLGEISFPGDTLQAPVEFPAVGQVPDFASADPTTYLETYMGEWGLSTTSPIPTAVVPLTTDTLDATLPVEQIALTIGELTLTHSIVGNRVYQASYTDADNWSYTETVNSVNTWTYSYDPDPAAAAVTGELSLALTKTRTDHFTWTITQAGDVFTYELKLPSGETVMMEETFQYDLSGSLSETDDENWLTTLQMGNAVDPDLPDTYHVDGTQTLIMLADGSSDTGTTPAHEDHYDLTITNDINYDQLTSFETESPTLDTNGDPTTLLTTIDVYSGDSSWEFSGTRDEYGDGTDVTHYDEDYHFFGEGSDTYDMETTGLFNETESNSELVTFVLDPETETTEDVLHDITTQTSGSIDEQASGSGIYEFDLTAEEHLSSIGELSNTADYTSSSSGDGSYSTDDVTTISVNSYNTENYDVSDLETLDLITDAGSFIYSSTASGNSDLTTAGVATGSGSSTYTETGTSTYNYDLTTVFTFAEGTGQALPPHLVIDSSDRFHIWTPVGESDSYTITDTVTSSRAGAVDTGTFNTSFISEGNFDSLTDYHEELTPLNDTSGSDPASGLSASESFWSELRDFSYGNDVWSSSSSSMGSFEVNSDTGYSRITVNSSYSDASDGAFDTYTKSDLTASTSKSQDVLDEFGVPTGDGTDESSSYQEHLLQGTIATPGTTGSLSGGAIEQHSNSTGTGSYEVITQAFDVDEDGTIEVGEQQATITITSNDAYHFGTGLSFTEAGIAVAEAEGILYSFTSTSSTDEDDSTDAEIETDTSSLSFYDEEGTSDLQELGYGSSAMTAIETLTTTSDWEDELEELAELPTGSTDPESANSTQATNPSETSSLTLTSSDYYRYDDTINSTIDQIDGSGYREKDKETGELIASFGTGSDFHTDNNQAHTWTLETMDVVEDPTVYGVDTITAVSEEGFMHTYTAAQGSGENMRFKEDNLEDQLIDWGFLSVYVVVGDYTEMHSTSETLSVYDHITNELSHVTTIATKDGPPDPVNTVVPNPEEPEPEEPTVPVDPYTYLTSGYAYAGFSEIGTSLIDVQESYHAEEYQLVSEGGLISDGLGGTIDDATETIDPTSITSNLAAASSAMVPNGGFQRPIVAHTEVNKIAGTQGLGAFNSGAGASSSFDDTSSSSSSTYRDDSEFTSTSNLQTFSSTTAGLHSAVAYDHNSSTTEGFSDFNARTGSKVTGPSDHQTIPSTRSSQGSHLEEFSTTETFANGSNTQYGDDFIGGFSTFYDEYYLDNIDHEAKSHQSNSFSIANGSNSSDRKKDTLHKTGVHISDSGTGKSGYQPQIFRVTSATTPGTYVPTNSQIGMHDSSHTIYNFFDETIDNNGRVDQTSDHSTETIKRNNFFYDFISDGGYTLNRGDNFLYIETSLSNSRKTSNYSGGQNVVNTAYKNDLLDQYNYNSEQVIETSDPQNPFITITKAEAGEAIYNSEFEGQASYDSSGNLVWDTDNATINLEYVGNTTDDTVLTQIANGSALETSGVMAFYASPVANLLPFMSITPDSVNWDAVWIWNDYAQPALSPQVLGSGSAMSVLSDPLTTLAGSVHHSEPEQIPIQGIEPDGEPNVPVHNLSYYEAAFGDPANNGLTPAPTGTVTPPAAFEKDPNLPAPPATPPANPEPTGTEEEHCADGEIQRTIVKITTSELYDDNGTPFDESDDILVGWAVTEHYNHDLTGYAFKTYLYDIDGNLVANLDYDRAEIINVEYLNGGLLITDPNRLVISPNANFQIKEVEAKAKGYREKVYDVINSEYTGAIFWGFGQGVNQSRLDIQDGVVDGLIDSWNLVINLHDKSNEFMFGLHDAVPPIRYADSLTIPNVNWDVDYMTLEPRFYPKIYTKTIGTIGTEFLLGGAIGRVTKSFKFIDDAADGVNLANKCEMEAILGKKLEYLFGNAKGSKNLDRTKSMLKQMERIGMRDTAENRLKVINHLQDTLNDPTNISMINKNGTVMRESLLMGPYGGVLMKSTWNGRRLESYIVKGQSGRYRFFQTKPYPQGIIE